MRSLQKKVLHIADQCSYGCGRGGLQAASSFVFSDSAGLRVGGVKRETRREDEERDGGRSLLHQSSVVKRPLGLAPSSEAVG